MIILTTYLLNLLVLALALILDSIFGEPPEKLHPTVWMGRVVAFLKPTFRSRSPSKARIGGIVLWLICVALFTIPTVVAIALAQEHLGSIGYVLVSAVILKTSFALKSWDNHMIPVSTALELKKVDDAKKLVQRTVRRDLSNADEQHIISAGVETIAEGIVDGYTSPIFYFALFATPGAIVYRVINTLDSMVGYRDQENVNLGWFSARMDTIANYLPARITAYSMLIASALLRENWRRSKDVLARYRGTTESPNSGWPMSAMAGALGVRLEKVGYHELGDVYEDLAVNHIHRALNIMKVTCAVFTVVAAVPLLLGSQLIHDLVSMV